MQKIGDSAFEGCAKLKNASFLSKNLEIIKHSTFYGCISLEHLSLPQELTGIESLAFYGCKSLKVVAIPMGVEIIGYSAFENCTNLKSIGLPPETEIGDDAFKGCTSLESISIKNSKGCAIRICGNNGILTIQQYGQ